MGRKGFLIWGMFEHFMSLNDQVFILLLLVEVFVLASWSVSKSAFHTRLTVSIGLITAVYRGVDL